MGEKNIKLGPGKMYINGEPFAGAVEGAEFTTEPEGLTDSAVNFGVRGASAALTFCASEFSRLAATAQEAARVMRDTAALLVIVAAYPTRRVRHLAQFGKNKRIRKKNQRRAVCLLARKEDKYAAV